MKWLILSALVLSALPFLKVANFKKEERYKQWYIPIVLFVEALILIYNYSDIASEIYKWLERYNLLVFATYAEYIVTILGMYAMLFTKKALKHMQITNIIEKYFPNFLSKSSIYNDTYFYLPYVKSPVGVRPGTGYISTFFLLVAILLVVIIALSLLVGHKYDIYIKSGLLGLCIPILLELYNFYKTNLQYVEDEKEKEAENSATEQSKSTFMPLWEEYTHTFTHCFDVAFQKLGDTNKQDINRQNEYAFNTLIDEFKNGKDILIEDLDIPSSFHNLSEVFFNSLSKGGNILILANITERINKKLDGKDTSMMELFSLHLSTYLQKKVPNANEVLKISYLSDKAGENQFKSRIILTTVTTILESDINNIQWFNDLDLLLVFNQNDKGRVNYFEYQKLNLLINKKTKDYRIVILSAFRQGLQTSMTRVWKLDRTCEKRIGCINKVQNRFCILANFEKWHENWLQQATPLGTNLYSGVELAIPAIASGVDKLSFLEVNNAEVREGVEALGLSRNHIKRYDISNINIDKTLEINSLPFFIFNERPQHISIIYDVENNSPVIYNKWAHLGETDNFSIIISKPYLFKSYFADNIALFENSPMYAIEPIPSLSKVNLAILLYYVLQEGKVSEKQIKSIVNDYDILLTHQAIPAFIKNLFIKYFGFDIEENSRLQVEEVVSFEKNKYIKSYLYSLSQFNISYFPQFASLRSIRIMDNRGILRFTILKDMLFQNYLPRQKHVFNGRTFEIVSYNEEEGILSIRNLPQFNNHLFYAPCFSINHKDNALTGAIEDYITFDALYSKFSLIQFESYISIKTSYYYEFQNTYQAITKSNNQEVFRVSLTSNEQEMVKRTYYNCRTMKLEWQLNEKYHSTIPLIQAGLHLLLYESFKTFFPYSYQYLVICSDRSQLTGQQKESLEHFPWIYPTFESIPRENCIEIFIFEDSISDMGVLNAIRENYVYIFQYLYDYLCWVTEPMANNKGNNNKENNSKYINNIEDKFSFLKYGFENISSFIDVKLLKEFAENHFPLSKIAKIELKEARKKFSNKSNSKKA